MNTQHDIKICHVQVLPEPRAIILLLAMGLCAAGLIISACGDVAPRTHSLTEGQALSHQERAATVRAMLSASQGGATVDAQTTTAADGQPARVSYDQVVRPYLTDFARFWRGIFDAKGIRFTLPAPAAMVFAPAAEVVTQCRSTGARACHLGDGSMLAAEGVSPFRFVTHMLRDLWAEDSAASPQLRLATIELVGSLRQYHYSAMAGSQLLRRLFSRSADTTVQGNSMDARRSRARLYVLVALLEHDGDLERTMESLRQLSERELRRRVADTMDQHPGLGRAELSFTLWNQLLDSPGFRAELLHPRPDPSRHGELIAYLRILNHTEVPSRLSQTDDQVQRLRALLDAFADDPNYANPSFRAEIVTRLSSALRAELEALRKLHGVGSWDAFPVAQRLVEINRHYPCHGDDDYHCPSWMRTPREWQLQAYLETARALGSDDFGSRQGRAALPVVQDFYGRFYGVDFRRSDPAHFALAGTPGVADNYAPVIALQTASALLTASPELALKLHRLGASSSCQIAVEHGPDYEQCKEARSACNAALQAHQ